ncbi:MAG: enoyl-CoA hydratase/isomerase family protein [Pseudomonadales bacterium]|nr:enoyl-CoA hydratase/isomerase family protein [Pseudomonadales bacterium]
MTLKGSVDYEVRGSVALLSIDNPPVNPLSSGVRQGLFENVRLALDNTEVKVIVITGRHRAFIAGADIGELGSVGESTVGLDETLKNMEESSKPIIAAINGTAFGGGLEVALCCDYRVANAKAPVGLPEVKLGLLPGAGGTQRLPRLIGAQAALDAILSGDPILAPAALQLGIVDEVTDGDVVDAAMNFAERLIAEGCPVRKIRDLTDMVVKDRGNTSIFQNARTANEKSRRNQFAPEMIVQCIEASINSDSFDEGMAVEQKCFAQCMKNSQREALIHVFFGERKAAKVAGIPKDTPLVAIKSASVVGSGTMGGGIAMNFANAGIPVTVYDYNSENLANGIKVIEGNYARTVKKGRLSQSLMDERMALISGTDDFDSLGSADVVVEAVYENLDLKKEIFLKLDMVMKPGAILATNTSGLDVDAIADVTARPESVVGMHFFSPANVMRLLEVVRGAKSSNSTLATAMGLGKQLGKVAVMAGNCPGFIGNRMLAGYTRQAALMILEGALPAQVDKVLYDFGMPMGPFAMNDMVGLDLGWRARKMSGGSNEVTVRIPDALCELGRYGQKNGKGYYLYKEGDRTPLPDPAADKVIADVCSELGLEQREFSDEEILKRCIYPLINIGAKILEEGMAQRPTDIDTVYLNGYGFPSYTGGPMWYADQIGLDHILADLEAFQQQLGDAWKPSELIRRLVKEGKNFASLED